MRNPMVRTASVDDLTRFFTELSTALTASLTPAAIVSGVAQACVAHLCDLCAVYLLDEYGILNLGGIARNESDLARTLSPAATSVGQVLRTMRPLVEEVAIVAPLTIGASCIGAISLLVADGEFEQRDLELAEGVARQLALALENANAFEREHRTAQRFRFLAQATDHLFEWLDEQAVVERVLAAMVREIADVAIAVSLRDGKLREVASAGFSPAAAEFLRRSALIEAARNHRPLLLQHDDASVMLVPLVSPEGQVDALMCATVERRFEDGDLDVFEEIGRRVSIALERAERSERERRLAQTLQRATLPSQFARVPGAAVSAIYTPAARDVQVGGDWYDAFDIDDRRVLLTIGDVAGHGLEASIVMGKLRHALNAVAMYESNPGRILNAGEQILRRRFPNEIATAFAAIIDSRERTITYANAGHPYPAMRLRDGSLQELVANGLPIGIRYLGDLEPVVTRSVDDVGMLVLYTDGLVECERDHLLGVERLFSALRNEAVMYLRNPAEFLREVCCGTNAPDDVAILALNFLNLPSWSFESSNARDARNARTQVVAALAAHNGPPLDLDAAELIFGELLGNVARHAPGRVDVALEARGEAQILHVIDGGSKTATCLRLAEPMAETGRGLWLIRELGGTLTTRVRPVPRDSRQRGLTAPLSRSSSAGPGDLVGVAREFPPQC